MLLRVNFATFTSNRGNFLNSTIASGLWSTFNIISMLLLTSRTSSVLGWTRNEILLFSALYNIIYSVYYCLFSPNLEDLPMIIHFGRLDSMLLKPVHIQFLTSCWKIGFNNIIRFVIGISFLFYLLVQMNIGFSPYYLALFMLTGISSVAIIYSIWFIVMTVTLWFSRLSNLPEFMFSVNGITRYPGEMYKNYSIILYIIFFPLTLVIATPVRAIVGKVQLQEVVVSILVACALFYLSNRFWNYALRFYTSAN